MKKKNYTNALKEYKGNLLLVGIHYDKETKEHMCRIETMEMAQRSVSDNGLKGKLEGNIKKNNFIEK